MAPGKCSRKGKLIRPAKKVKQARTATATKKKSSRGRFPVKIMFKILQNIDDPVTAICFGLANSTCQAIFAEYYPKLLPENIPRPDDLLSSSVINTKGQEFRISHLLADFMGRGGYGVFDAEIDRFIHTIKIQGYLDRLKSRTRKEFIRWRCKENREKCRKQIAHEEEIREDRERR